MDINIIKIGLLIIATQFLLSAGCNKDGTSCLSTRALYSFEAEAEWVPQKETYNIGDTLFIISSIPRLLTDKFSNTQIDYTNAVGIGGNINISIVDTIAKTTRAARYKFIIVQKNGSIGEASIAPENGPAYVYEETAAHYQFKFGFVCKEKGIFLLGVSDLLSPGLRGKNCTKAGFDMTVKNSDKHISLYQKALGFPPDPDGLKRIYCFRVQ